MAGNEVAAKRPGGSQPRAGSQEVASLKEVAASSGYQVVAVRNHVKASSSWLPGDSHEGARGAAAEVASQEAASQEAARRQQGGGQEVASQVAARRQQVAAKRKPGGSQ